MWGFLLRRVLIGIATLWVVTALIFAGTEILPGDVATAMLGQYATPEAIAAIRHSLDLDRPAVVRYADWLGSVLSGDFGNSMARNEPIAPVLSERLANTLLLAGVTAVIAVPLALALGLLSAWFHHRGVDRFIGAATLVLVSVPEFLIGYLLIIWLSRNFAIFPSIADIPDGAGIGARLHAISLPVLTLTLVVVAYMTRMTRAAILSLLDSPYIEMARLKGISEPIIILRHALPNAIGPIANIVALNLAYLVVGVIVVEVVFVYPGIGQLMVDGVAAHDVPIVQACGIVFGATYVILNLLADIASLLGDPRVRTALKLRERRK
jgi:peptide/nickel transport system permease protein